ncbi:MAG: pantetheine-phosphate adenylyltransferase [Buchnera aphidicola (Meitanaphis flavogallis)]
MKKKAIYPGTFDPITFGHLDILKKATKIFNFVIVAVFEDSEKKTLFNIKERIKLIQQVTYEFKTITKIISFKNLLVHVAQTEKIDYIIRGMRTSLDFEYELKMFTINKKLAPNLENILFFPSPKFAFISSSLIKEIVKYGGNAKDYIPELVQHALLKKYKK